MSLGRKGKKGGPDRNWERKEVAGAAQSTPKRHGSLLRLLCYKSKHLLPFQSTAHSGCSSPNRSYTAPSVTPHCSNSNACWKKQAVELSLDSILSQGFGFTCCKMQVNRERTHSAYSSQHKNRVWSEPDQGQCWRSSGSGAWGLEFSVSGGYRDLQKLQYSFQIHFSKRL